MNKSEKAIAGGFSNGEMILIPETKTSAEIFMVLFHELGHNIDTQHDIKKVLLSTGEILTSIIDISNEEAQWLLEESQQGWPTQGISIHHKSITRKLLEIILRQGVEIKRDIRELKEEEFNQALNNVTVLGSDLTNDDESDTQVLEIKDHKIHRNSEVPADFIMELMFDVLNKSINKRFGLAEHTRVFKVDPDERNMKTTNIARFLIKKGWQSPSFHHKRNNQE